MSHGSRSLNKVFLQEQNVIEDSFRLGVQIFESGFRPNFIVGLWRGGSAVGIYVQECLQTLGIETDHIALRTSYPGLPNYKNMVETPERIRVHGTQYLIENLNANDGLLIVDDVFSSGQNINAVLQRLRTKLKRNMPSEVKVASLYQRKGCNRTNLKPDFCLHKTDDWLVFPYELKGLSESEIAEQKPFITSILKPK